MENITKEQLIERATQFFNEGNSVDVVKIANDLGISVYTIENGDSFNAKISFIPDTAKFEITVNQSHPFTRQRFSIAHELAHYVLHNDDVRQLRELDRLPVGHENYSQKEIEADNFAAEILMPETVVKSYALSVGVEEGGIFPKEILTLIAQKFKVSPMMAILRLKKLNYIVPYISFA